LFPRAIPEGIPVSCALANADGSYVLAHPGWGTWFVFAVTVPWSATGAQLATLDGFARGRSGPIRTAEGVGAGEIELSPARLLDPPVLTALSVLMSRMLARSMPQTSSSTRATSAFANHVRAYGDLLNLGEERPLDFQ